MTVKKLLFVLLAVPLLAGAQGGQNQPGETLHARPGTVHAHRNASSVPMR